MNAASEARKRQDKVVVISLLVVAELIALAGLVIEFDLIAKGFDYLGEFGMFVVLFIILNGAMLGACWWLGKQYDNI